MLKNTTYLMPFFPLRQQDFIETLRPDERVGILRFISLMLHMEKENSRLVYQPPL